MASSTNNEREATMPEKLVVAGVFALIAYPSWVWSGGRPDLAAPLGWLSLLAIAILLLAPLTASAGAGARLAACGGRWLGLLRDPVVYAGALLLAILYVHTWNAWWPDGAPTDDPVAWFDRQPRIEALPAAVSGPEGRLMFLQMAAALAAAVAIRHGLKTRRSVALLYVVMLINAGALALFGLAQYFSGSNAIYWLSPRSRHFFATFFYANHAGQYFYLMFALAIGYAAYLLCRRRVRTTKARLALLSSLLALTFLAAVFSLSRTAIVVVCSLFIGGTVYIVRRLSAQSTPVARIYILTGLGAVCVAGLVFVSGTIGDDIRKDFTRTQPGESIFEHSLAARTWTWRAATHAWQTHPWTGVGSYGFHYFLPFYVDADHLREVDKDHGGVVYSDFLQFLCEWGVLGVVPLLIILAAFIAPLIRSPYVRREIVLFPLLGAAIVVVHSLFDLPFRCPAVLLAWTILVCGSRQYVLSLAAESQRREARAEAERPAA